MGEKLIYQGRPLHGFAPLFLYGITYLSFGIIIAAIEMDAIMRTIGLVVIVLVMVGFGSLLLFGAALQLRLRLFEIDDIGMRMRIGSSVKWEVLWGEIRAIGTSSFGGKMPRTGFFITTEKKTYHVNNRDDFGPREKLIEAFRLIANRSAGSNVMLEDPLGWCSDLNLQFGRPPGTPKVDASLFMGKWHNAVNSKEMVKIGGIAGGIPIAAGLLMLLIGYLNKYDTICFMSVFIIIGLGFIFLIMLLYLLSPTAIYFDSNGVSLKFPFGGIKESSWRGVRKCGFVTETGGVTIWFEGQGSGWIGRFPTGVGEAMHQVYSEERAKEAIRGDPQHKI